MFRPDYSGNVPRLFAILPLIPIVGIGLVVALILFPNFREKAKEVVIGGLIIMAIFYIGDQAGWGNIAAVVGIIAVIGIIAYVVMTTQEKAAEERDKERVKAEDEAARKAQQEQRKALVDRQATAAAQQETAVARQKLEAHLGLLRDATRQLANNPSSKPALMNADTALGNIARDMVGHENILKENVLQDDLKGIFAQIDGKEGIDGNVKARLQGLLS